MNTIRESQGPVNSIPFRPPWTERTFRRIFRNALPLIVPDPDARLRAFWRFMQWRIRVTQ